MRVGTSPRFDAQVQALLGARVAPILAALTKRLRTQPYSGQQVKGSNLYAHAVNSGDGFVFLAYYSIAGDEITLESLLKRQTPLSQKSLGLED